MTTSRIASMFFLAVLLTVAAPEAPAQRKGFGLGVILGEPTGFSAKGWIDSRSAIDAGLAWSFLHETTFHVHVDYLLHTSDLTERSDMPAYYGIGGRIKAGTAGGDRIGIRIVGGIVYFVPDSPVDIFGEIAPILDFSPSTDLQVNGGIGARYYFN
jgi:hypothetical protein